MSYPLCRRIKSQNARIAIQNSDKWFLDPVQGTLNWLLRFQIRFQIDNNRWQKLPSGPSARYKAPMAAYQRHILVVGGITNETEKSDIWGFHLDLNQWLPWIRNIPRQINGFGFVKNDVFYCIGEARKSNYVTIYGYDLVERKLHNFYHKLPVSKP